VLQAASNAKVHRHGLPMVVEKRVHVIASFVALDDRIGPLLRVRYTAHSVLLY